MNAKRVSSDNITKLNKHEIFVFGSNKQGEHKGGAAAYAFAHFGAEWGVGEGMTGQCYALPTMSGILDLIDSIHKFVRYAKFCSIFMPWRKFLVTKVGCGIAGYSIYGIATIFKGCGAFKLKNLYMPEDFYSVLEEHKIL